MCALVFICLLPVAGSNLLDLAETAANLRYLACFAVEPTGQQTALDSLLCQSPVEAVCDPI